jgi:pyridoxal 5'-phosphate synthase pdxT subunit
VRVGILALQGDFTPHRKAVERLGHEPVRVRYPGEFSEIDALILPGGESTTIGMLLERWDLVEPLLEAARQGLPIWGTCAGAILLAREVEGTDQFRLGLMDIAIERNAYGRQVDSFETDLTVQGIEGTVRGVFIRAPIVRRVWGSARVIATREGETIAVRDGRLLATTFHPEIAEDDRILEGFLAGTLGNGSGGI